MDQARRLFLFVVCAGALVWAHVGAAHVGATCTCPPKSPPYEAIADANLVFAGRVTRIEQPAAQLTLQRTPPFVLYNVPMHAPIQVTLVPYEYWRGPVAQAIVVTTGQYYSCGVTFREGAEYLVYAYYNGADALMTHRCSRTSELQFAQEDLALFGRGAPPIALTAPTSTLPIVASLLALVLTLVFAVVWHRRQIIQPNQ